MGTVGGRGERTGEEGGEEEGEGGRRSKMPFRKTTHWEGGVVGEQGGLQQPDSSIPMSKGQLQSHSAEHSST